MNLPNSLTVLRIFFVPLLIAVLLTKSPNVDFRGFPMHFEFWGVLILLLAAATDWADGFFARRRQIRSSSGRWPARRSNPQCVPKEGSAAGNIETAS